MLVPAFNPGLLTGRGNNTWLLDGAEPALIDAGLGQREHVEAIAAALGGRSLVRVLVTHGHSDHASGAPALQARWPEVELHKWPASGEAGWRPLADGQRLRAGDRELEVVYTPGHAIDHVCFWDAAARELYAGDMVALGTTIVVPGERGGGMRAYLASLERLASLKPARILPGHGDVIERPLELIAEFVEHRRMRETQVLACLNDGITDPDDMVARIYPDLPAGLRPAARQTVEAHLGKLKAEGRIMIRP